MVSATAENSPLQLDRAYVEIQNPPSLLILTFNAALDGTSTPAATAFQVNVEGRSPPVTVTEAQIFPPFFGANVFLTLSSPVRPGEDVTISYVKPLQNQLKDNNGLQAAGFMNVAVTNDLPNTAPEAPGNVGTSVVIEPANLGASAGAFILHWTEPHDGGDAITKYQFRTRPQSGSFGSWTDIALSDVGERGGKKAFEVTAGVGGNYTLLRNQTSQTGPTWEVTYDVEMRAVNGVDNGTATAATVSTVAWWFELELLDSSIEEGETGRIRIHVRHDAPDGFLSSDGFGASFGVNWSATDASYVTPSSGTAEFAANQTSVDVSLTALEDSQAGVQERTIDFELTGTDQGSKMPVGNPKPTVGILVRYEGPPGAPENLEAESLDHAARLTWEPADDGGLPILRYEYQQSTDGGMTWNPEWATIQGSGAGTMEHTVRGLQNSTAYTFEVRAVNSLGDGAASNQATAYPPGIVSSAPQNLTAVEDNQEVELGWMPPADDGGWPIIRYEYRYSTDGGLKWRRDWTQIPNSANNSIYLIRNLTNSTAYTFQLRAVTVVGAGAEASVIATPQTVGRPGVPRSPSLSSGDGKVTLQWIPPRLTGARPILGYDYRRDSEEWVRIPNSEPGGANHGRYELSYPNGWYSTVYLRAVNEFGGGAEAHRGAMAFAGAPGPPGNFKATLISDDEFELSWTEPAAAPGVTIVGYIIDGSPDGVTDWDQRSYEIEVPGPTSMTGRIGLRTGYFRIRTQFQVDTPEYVDGQEFSWGMSDTSPVVRVRPGETSVDPALPQIRVWDAFAREGRDVAVVFTVRLVPALTSTVTVDYRTEDVRATDPDDYWATSGTLTFAPGETEKTVSVPVVDDDVEDSGEEFALLLSHVSGARLGDEGAAGVIYNEEDVLGGFTLVDESGTEIAALGDGTAVTLDDPATGSFGIVARAAPDAEIGSVRLELTGAKAVTHTDDAAPYSLYGDTGGTVQGEALPAGRYTLSATAYAEANGAGDVLDTRTVSFTVTASAATAGDALPVISGTARVGEMLTASVDGIDDADGLENTAVAYQWLSNDGAADTDIESATDSTYTLVAADAGKTVTVRVTYTDDGGTEASLVSAATAPVAVAGSSELSVAEASEKEDTALEFVVTLDPEAGGTVTVDYATADGTATAGDDYDSTNGTLTFEAGETTKTVSVPITADTEDDGGETLTLTLSHASGAGLGDVEATGTILNTGDAAGLSASVPASRFASTRHTGSDDRPQVVVTFSEAVAAFAANTPSVQVTGGTISSVQAHTEDGLAHAWLFFLTPDGDGDVTFALVADAACTAGGLCTAGGTVLTEVPATLTIPGPEAAADDDADDDAEDDDDTDNADDTAQALLTASFGDVPAEHDGQNAFTVRVAFSEDVGISYKALRDESFSVTDGDVTGARRVDGRHDLWEITVEPESREAVTISLPGGRACGPAGAVCTRGDDPRPLSNSPSATVAGPAEDPAVTNTAATGAPTISGTAQVDETLTASVSGISDADGLDNASYEYQWIRGNTDIQDATDSSYTLVSVDEGETITVRVTFSDDKGHEESLTSAATDAVAPAPAPLTATFTDVPAEHAGAGETFTFGLTFSEHVAGLSYKTLRDAAFFGDERTGHAGAPPDAGQQSGLDDHGRAGLARGVDGDVAGRVGGDLGRPRPRERRVRDGPRTGGDRGGRCAGGRSRRRRAGLRGDAGAGGIGHGDGGLCHGGRHGHGGRGLYRHQRHAPLRRWRDIDDGVGHRTRRRP